jgi:hypothetical protein
MARIESVSDRARGPRRAALALARRRYGGIVPGIYRLVAVDLRLALAVGDIYGHLHLRRRSPLTRLQREMLATVVNGLVGGAP